MKLLKSFVPKIVVLSVIGRICSCSRISEEEAVESRLVGRWVFDGRSTAEYRSRTGEDVGGWIRTPSYSDGAGGISRAQLEIELTANRGLTVATVSAAQRHVLGKWNWSLEDYDADTVRLKLSGQDESVATRMEIVLLDQAQLATTLPALSEVSLGGVAVFHRMPPRDS